MDAIQTNVARIQRNMGIFRSKSLVVGMLALWACFQNVSSNFQLGVAHAYPERRARALLDMDATFFIQDCPVFFIQRKKMPRIFFNEFNL